MTCPHCGQQTRAAASFCTRCGKLREPGAQEAARPTPAIPAPPASPQAPLTPQWSAPKPKRRRKLPLLVAGIVAVAAAITGAVVCCGDDETPPTSGSVPPGKIVFASDRSGNHDVFIADNDGTNVRNLTDSPSRDEPSATSPDGNHIAFRSDRDETYEIFSMDADGRNVKRLTDGEGQNFWPTYSPDSSQIAFTRDRDGGTGIWIMVVGRIERPQGRLEDADVPRLQGVAQTDARAVGLHVRRIVDPVRSHQRRQHRHLLVSVSSGRGLRSSRPTKPRTGRRRCRRTARRSCSRPTARTENAMYTMGPDGSDPTRLSGAGSVPSFTPDGGHIVFTRNDDVWIMDAGGGDARPLMQTESGEHAPGWLT